MKIFKNFFLFVVIVAVPTSLYVYLKPPVPCREPITYSLGAFDERFGISETDFVETMKEAEEVWERVDGKELLSYETDGHVMVNLIYDDRQEEVEKSTILKTEISGNVSSHSALAKEYEAIKADRLAAIDIYKSLRAEYESQARSYAAEVEKWNDQGGAPKSVYRELNQKGDEISALFLRVDDARKEVNRLTDRLNTLADQLNTLARETNTTIEEYNRGTYVGREFEEGEYVVSGRDVRIDIYQFSTREQLVRVLAHEFGHALGLGHNENPDSIMYELNHSTNMIPTIEDIRDLRIICREAASSPLFRFLGLSL